MHALILLLSLLLGLSSHTTTHHHGAIHIHSFDTGGGMPGD